jgi:hypothetical protein
VGVKCYGRFEFQIVNDDLAGAVGEAPAGSGSRLEENPRPVNLM